MGALILRRSLIQMICALCTILNRFPKNKIIFGKTQFAQFNGLLDFM